LAVRCYLRFGLSHPDVKELRAEQGVEVDHLTVYLWANGSRRCWPWPPGRAGTRSGEGRFVDETYTKVAGRSRIASSEEQGAGAGFVLYRLALRTGHQRGAHTPARRVTGIQVTTTVLHR
jgi:hypothetical protein